MPKSIRDKMSAIERNIPVALKPPSAELPPAMDDPQNISRYLADESAAFGGNARKVFLPADARQAATVVHAARQAKILLTLSAAGTSITGSRVPTDGGWVLSTERMRSADAPAGDEWKKISRGDLTIYLDAAGKRASLPAGIRLCELAELLAPHKLMYPPDPTEMTAMLGGTIATNASGARSFNFGPTRRWIERLQLVLPTGDILEVPRGNFFAQDRSVRIATPDVDIAFEIPANYPAPKIKNAAGPMLTPNMDIIDLFIGNEGLFGVATQAIVRLVDLPEDILTVAVFFPNPDDAINFVDHLRAGDNNLPPPMSIEFFDRRSLDFMRGELAEIPVAMAGAVLTEFAFVRREKNNPYPPEEILSPLISLTKDCHAATTWSAVGSGGAEFKKFRHSLPESVNRYVRARVGKLGTDLAVPSDRFAEIYLAYDSADAIGVPVVIFGHIGDCHLHLNFLPADRDQLTVAKKKYLELARLAVSMGGTVSAEHGVGKKTLVDETGATIPYLQVMIGKDRMCELAKIKIAFDPDVILNISNVIPAGMLAK